MTEHTIADYLIRNLYDIRRTMAFQNISYGFFDSGKEADLLILSASGYLTEIEIKLTAADFKAERKKQHRRASHFHSDKNIIKYLYYAMPSSAIKIEMLPDYAGLIVISKDHKNHIILAKPRANKFASDLSYEQQSTLYRLQALRSWSHLAAVIRLQGATKKEPQKK